MHVISATLPPPNPIIYLLLFSSLISACILDRNSSTKGAGGGCVRACVSDFAERVREKQMLVRTRCEELYMVASKKGRAK